MTGRIYLIENQINHKQYIGKTYNSIEERWREHCKDYQKDSLEDTERWSARCTGRGESARHTLRHS